MSKRLVTIYRGDVTTGQEQTEILIQPKEPWRSKREYTNPRYSQLKRIKNLLRNSKAMVYAETEILKESIYITFELEFKE